MAGAHHHKKCLEAIADFGRAATRVRRAQEEVDLLEVQWLDMASFVCEDFVEDYDGTSETINDALVQFLRTGDQSLIPNQVSYHREDLTEMRQEILAEYNERLRELEAVAGSWEQPHQTMVQELRGWLATAKAADADSATVAGEWAAVLKAWRKAADLTTREAAERLGVSPSAITRYEGGTRAASLPYIASMIEQIDAVGNAERNEKLRKVVRTFASMVGHDDPTQVLEETEAEAERSNLRNLIHDRLGELSAEQLAAVARLVQPAALQALDTLVSALAPDAVEEVL